MNPKLAALAAYASLALLVFTARATLGADFPGLPDGGSLVQPSLVVTTLSDGGLSDGGMPSVITVDTARTDEWVATLRCTTNTALCWGGFPSPRVFYRFSASDAGVARTVDQILEVDRTFDIPVPLVRGAPLRYLSFLGEDGGAPCCNVQRQDPP